MRQAICLKSFQFPPVSTAVILLTFAVFDGRATAEESRNPKAAADCGKEEWVEGPGIEDGVFAGTLEIRCRILGASQSTVEGLRSSIEARIRRTKKVASETAGPGEDGLPASSFDATTILNEGEGSSEVSLRDRIEVGSNERERLLYRTESIEIRATGMGSHLKSVGFHSDLRAEPGAAGAFSLVMRNRIAIARPWYAAPVFFTPIAKRITLDKFRRARQVLLDLILTRLSGQEPPAEG